MRVLAASALTFLLAGMAAAQTPTADPPPAAVKPGATLETSGFQYERRLPEGPSELVTLPLDPAVARAGDEGRPVFLSVPTGVVATAYRALAGEVADALEAA